MLTQNSFRQNVVHRKFVLGPHPIIQYYLQQLRLEETIGSFMKQDARQKMSIEGTLCVLVHNILTSPMPMYEIGDWAAPISEECLGLDVGQLALIHDDRVGRALDCFYAGRHKDVFFRLALRAIKIFDLDCSQMHQDTTTVTFSGKYRGWSAEELLALGHNKDHWPDLQQLVLGMSVTADGAVPLVHEIYDGNQTDDRLHPENHRRLRKLLERSDFIYVADSKLATADNLSKITAAGGRFISVMPRTWKEDKSFRQLVRQNSVRWNQLLTRRNNRNPDSKTDKYSLAEGEYKTSQGYDLLWIHSTQKAEQDGQTRSRHIQQTMDNLRELQTKLNRYKLKSRTAIEAQIKKILKDNQCHHMISYHIHSHKQFRIKHNKLGRPKLNSAGRKIWSEYFSIVFAVDQSSVRNESLADGIFPLITNVLEDYSARRILEIYKFQPFLEKRHSQLKTWQEITPVLLKKSQRIVALLHVHVMALMVATLMERKLRLAMHKHKIPALPLYPENRPCKYPTTFDIVRLFREVEKYEVEQNGVLTIFPAQLNKIQKEVLKLLEVPLSLYQ